MAQEKLFDGVEYFLTMAKENKLCKQENFFCGTCTGPESLQTVLAEFRSEGQFVLVDDTHDGTMFSNKVGRFVKRVYTVFILARYDWDDLKERQQKLDLCRRIFRQFISRVLRDRKRLMDYEAMDFMHLDSMFVRELGRYSMNGVTGLYFMLENDEPIDLVYEEDDWQD